MNSQLVMEIPKSTIESIRQRFEGYKGFDYDKDQNLLSSIARDEFDKLVADENADFMKSIIEQLVDSTRDNHYSELFRQLLKSRKVIKPSNGRGKRIHRGRHRK